MDTFDFASLVLEPLDSRNKRTSNTHVMCTVRLTSGNTGGAHSTNGRNLTVTVRDAAMLKAAGLKPTERANLATVVLPTGERVLVAWPNVAGAFKTRKSPAGGLVIRLGHRPWMDDVLDHSPLEAHLSVETFARGEQRLVVRLPNVYSVDATPEREEQDPPVEDDSIGEVKVPVAPTLPKLPPPPPPPVVAPPEPPVKRGPGRPPKDKSATTVVKSGPRPTAPPKKDRLNVAGNALAQAMANRPVVQAKRNTSFESQFPPVTEPDVNKTTRMLTFSNGRQVHLSNEYDLVKVVFEIIRNQARGMPSALSVLQRQLHPLPDGRPSLGETKVILADLAIQLEKAGVDLHCSTDLMYAIRIEP